MANNPKNKIEPTNKKRNQNELIVIRKEGESDEALNAKLAYDPAVRSLAASRKYIKNMVGEQGLTESLDALTAQIKEFQSGRFGDAEATLVAQANTLDAIFNELARRAALNMGEYLSTAETYLRLALKAQSQCRATLEALSTIKNPPMMGYVKQANIAHGHQQVNNRVTTNSSRTQEKENQQNELLEIKDGERLDTGKTGETIGTNTAMEAMGAVERPKNCPG